MAGNEQTSLTKELSILDGVYVLAKYRTFILAVTVLATLLGVFFAIKAPKEYTSSAVLVREAQQESAAGGLSALRGLGLNLGDSGPGLTIEAYPNILTSREVQAAIIHESLPLSDGNDITMLEYNERYAKGPGISGTLRRLIRGESSEAESPSVARVDSFATSYTVNELEAMTAFSEMLSVSSDVETGLMTVTVSARDPVFAASLAGRTVEELRVRVQDILTKKAREDYEFIRDKTQEAEEVLTSARAVLARFNDRNLGSNSAQLAAQRDRLRQEVTFAVQVYGESQSELKRAELEVQRANPVVTVLDRPVVPHLPSKPRRALMVVIAFLLGLCGSVLLSFLFEGVQAEGLSEQGEQKREAIRSMLIPKWITRRGRKNKKAGKSDEQPTEDANPT